EMLRRVDLAGEPEGAVDELVAGHPGGTEVGPERRAHVALPDVAEQTAFLLEPRIERRAAIGDEAADGELRNGKLLHRLEQVLEDVRRIVIKTDDDASLDPDAMPHDDLERGLDRLQQVLPLAGFAQAVGVHGFDADEHGS